LVKEKSKLNQFYPFSAVIKLTNCLKKLKSLMIAIYSNDTKLKI